MKKIKLKTFIILSIFCSIACMEFLAKGYICLSKQGCQSVSDLYKKESAESAKEKIIKEGCTWNDAAFPHPYLAYVHHNNDRCGRPLTNNVGMSGSDYPVVKDPNEFLILLTGGSVAHQINFLNQNYMEKKLNELYLPPRGIKFRILNGGEGGWKYPQQIILFLLYSQILDGVITLDGYNEHLSIRAADGFSLNYPAATYKVLTHLSEQSTYQYFLMLLYQKIFYFARNTVVISHSSFFYLVFKLVRDLILDRIVTLEQTRSSKPLSTESIFSLGSMSPDEMVRYNLNLYKRYIRSMDVLAKNFNIKRAFFIQPHPHLDKTLTEEERKVCNTFYPPQYYSDEEKSLMLLKNEGIPIYSLRKIYLGSNETIYSDHIHCKIMNYGNEGNMSLGYTIMGNKIIEMIAKEWNLKKIAK